MCNPSGRPYAKIEEDGSFWLQWSEDSEWEQLDLSNKGLDVLISRINEKEL